MLCLRCLVCRGQFVINGTPKLLFGIGKDFTALAQSIKSIVVQQS